MTTTVKINLSAEIANGEDTLTATIKDGGIELTMNSRWAESSISISVSEKELESFVEEVKRLVTLSVDFSLIAKEVTYG